MADQIKQETVVVGGDITPPAPLESEPPPPTVFTSLNPIWFWLLAVLLTGVGFYLLWFHIPRRQTDIAKNGVKEDAYVVMKDSTPLGDGRMIMTVTFVYPDAQKKNHSITNRLDDSGLWESLKQNQMITIYYLPSNPDIAYMKGAEAIVLGSGTLQQKIIRVVAPHSSALSFLGWTALILSIPVWILAYFGSKEPKRSGPKPTGPKVIITHR